MAFLPVLCSPAFSGFSRLLWVLFSHMVHTLRDGVTPVGLRQVYPRSERRFVCFPFPFGAVSSCRHCPWGFGHHMGQCVGWFQLLHDRRFSLVLRTFSFWMCLEPLSVAPLCARLLRGGFLVVLAVDESLWLSLALSSVLPCNLFWLHVCLPGTGSGPSVVLGALP